MARYRRAAMATQHVDEVVPPGTQVAARPRLAELALLRRWSSSRPALAAVLAVGVVVSWATRWVVDDTYITFRFSQNLAEGRGPVFNPGERVEGYTNFLWMVLNAVPHALGWDPLPFAQAAGLVAYLGIGAATVALARRVLGDGGLVVVALVLVAGNGTVLRFATSGMETPLAVALVLGAVVLLTDPTGGWAHRPGRLAAASVLAGLAVLTRLDTAVVLAVWFAAWAWAARREPLEHRPPLAAWAAASVPGIALVVPWLVWKLAYYGSVLPNTLTAKSGGVRWQMLVVGLVYLTAFVVTYGLVVLLPRAARVRAVLAGPYRGPLLAVLVLWPCYVVWVGGDWMEFRFMVMYVPFLGLAVAGLLDEVVAWWRHGLMVAVLAAASALHVLPLPLLGVFSPSAMDSAAGQFRAVGEELQRRFPGDVDDADRPFVAVGAAGAMVYASELRALDVLGLTDATVARTGERAKFYFPGHQIISPVEYLLRREVDFVLVMDGPIDVDPDRDAYRLSEVAQYYPIVDLRVLPRSVSVLEIPSPIGTVRALELRRHPDVDRLVEAGTWRRYPVEFRCDPADITDYLRSFGTRTCPDV